MSLTQAIPMSTRLFTVRGRWRSETIKERESKNREQPAGLLIFTLCLSCASLWYSISHHRKELTSPMTYVVVELCVDCKYTDCAAVCPVEAFHELPDRLSIYADSNVPENYAHWTQINIDEAPKYPIISQKIPALHGSTCTGPEE